ncbi:MAG: hypothetical protein AB7Q45_16625, partial [Planctomycetaceae bacterium]
MSYNSTYFKCGWLVRRVGAAELGRALRRGAQARRRRRHGAEAGWAAPALESLELRTLLTIDIISTPVVPSATAQGTDPSVSDDGRYVAFTSYAPN